MRKHRLLVHLSLLAVLFAVIAIDARPAAATLPGDNGRIAFSSGYSPTAIKSVQPDGTEVAP